MHPPGIFRSGKWWKTPGKPGYSIRKKGIRFENRLSTCEFYGIEADVRQMITLWWKMQLTEPQRGPGKALQQDFQKRELAPEFRLIMR